MPTDSPTQELIEWGSTYYVYSTIAHVRQILRTLQALALNEDYPASFIIGRHIFEWAAQTCYLNSSLAAQHTQQRWTESWQMLSCAVAGNLWAKRHGHKHDPDSKFAIAEIDNPIRIGVAVESYDDYRFSQGRKRDAFDDWGLLSEYSHPNSACLQQYHRYDPNGMDVSFGQPYDDHSPLPLVNVSLIDMLKFFHEMLGLSKEKVVRPQIILILRQLIAFEAPD